MMSLTILFSTQFVFAEIFIKRGNNIENPFSLIFLILGLFFLAPIGVGYGFFASFRHEKREKIFRAYAVQNGWEYNSCDDSDIYFPNKDRYRVFSFGKYSATGMIYSLARKPFENGDVYVFDYYYNKVGGKYPIEGKMTAIAFHSKSYNLPFFSLYPEGLFGSFGEIFGSRDIDFPTHPKFSSRYKLTGEDETQIRQIFHPKVLSFFENTSDTYVDGGGTHLFIYTLDCLASIENLDNFVMERVNVLNAFRQI